MTSDAFRTDIDEARGAGLITFSRPKEGNRFRAEDLPGLGEAVRSLGARPDIKTVMIQAEGEHFCLGRLADPSLALPETALGLRSRVTDPILAVYADLRATEVPVIAVVRGEARGFGCALVGQCDLAICAHDARFSLPEMDHHLPPALAMSALLHKVPPKRLLQMVYTREAIGAEEALAIGLVSEVAPAARLDEARDRILSRLSDRKRAALCAVKEYMGAGLYADPHGAARLAANLLASVLSSL